MNRAAKTNGYKNGGVAAKKSGTTVNIVVPTSRGEAAPKALPIAPAAGDMARAPSPMPSPPAGPPPMPMPSPGQAGLAALGAPPMARGGRVKSPKINISTGGPDAKPMLKAMQKSAISELDKWGKADGGPVVMKAGAGSALGRMEKAKAAKAK